ncbi:hypothetical protein SADUNF_Sadunf19G0007200 [Salix dunnii]|uniref:Uncharacterized protein n=1 Tax=Salix dunnii TaxID=1413687 RepID=A0A835J0H3_9ROSI|nr:hypothetical protein SADUNF_Sadunf19G0007200 [Salix dunnii]
MASEESYLSSDSALFQVSQANQRHQEQVVTHQSFGTSATPFSSAPAAVHRTACLCTYNRGFKNSQACSSCNGLMMSRDQFDKASSHELKLSDN